MKYTLLYYENKLYAKISEGILPNIDPPDVFYCIEIKTNIVRDILSTNLVTIIPKCLCLEISDINKLQTILILYS